MQSLRMDSETALLVIDVQDRLLAAMPEEANPDLLKYVRTLVRLADEFDASITYTEQYPDGLGRTEESVLEALEEAGAERIVKKDFDVCRAGTSADFLANLPERVVVAGTETHVCVWTTVRSLVERSHRVIVPFDAVASRRPAYRQNGLELIRECGATVANTETMVFDSLGDADHAAFKEFSRLIR